MKTELKQAFLQNYTPGNYTDEEFGEMASEFEKDLDELLDEVSREVAIDFSSDYIQVEKELIKPEYDNWLKEQEEKK